MEQGQGSNNGCNQRGKSSEGNVFCFCGLRAKICKSWTDTNPGRRFYGCERYKRRGECKFFKWVDKEEAFGWQKQALIEARDEIREKNKIIEQMRMTIAELRAEKEKKIEEEENIISKFLKL